MEWIDLSLDERARLEAAAEGPVTDALREQVRAALEGASLTGHVQLDPAITEQAMRSIATDSYSSAFRTSLEYHGVRAKSLREILDAMIEAYIRAHVMLRLQVMNDTTRRMVALAILDGMAEGKDARRTAALLLERWTAEAPEDGPVSYARALRIVRTEVGGAQMAAHLSGAKEAGMTHKKWVSVVDPRTRQNPPMRYPYRGFDHRVAWDEATGEGTNGQVVRISDPFRVSRELMQHPIDPPYGASPGNQVNCRCAVQYLFKRE